MTIPVLLIGILIAMGIFAALGWSVAQAAQRPGRPRLIHGAHAILVLLSMALISLELVLPARLAGGLTAVAAACAVWIEPGWSKLFPLVGLAFGLTLLLGLPFAGG